MLKKWFLVGAMLLLSAALVVGCGGIPQEDYDAVVADRDASKAQATSLQSDLTAAESDLTTAQSDLTAAESDLNTAEGKVSSLQSQVSSLSSDLATAEERIAELEAAEEPPPPPPPPPEEEEEEEEEPPPPPADGECDGIAAADVTNDMAGDTITVYGMVTGNETEMFSNDGLLLIDDISAGEFAIHIKPDDVDNYPALEDYVGKMVCVTGVVETHSFYATPGLRLSDDPADIVAN
jgi:TolA-binding protein